MENKELKIKEEYLKELISYIGRSLCGKVMKRLEISGNTDNAKTQIKELIYEEMRQFRDLLIAHNCGMDELMQFKFNKSKGE